MDAKADAAPHFFPIFFAKGNCLHDKRVIKQAN
jgi:hypothetical protein